MTSKLDRVRDDLRLKSEVRLTTIVRFEGELCIRAKIERQSKNGTWYDLIYYYNEDYTLVATGRVPKNANS